MCSKLLMQTDNCLDQQLDVVHIRDWRYTILFVNHFSVQMIRVTEAHMATVSRQFALSRAQKCNISMFIGRAPKLSILLARGIVSGP